MTPSHHKTRSLRQALTTTVATINHLREWGDDELLVQAEELRAALTRRLPRQDERRMTTTTEREEARSWERTRT